MASDSAATTTSPASKMDPDETLLRYRFDELRQCKSSKPLLFENIDFNTYSPHARLCGFETSAEKLPIWIDVILHRYFYNLSSTELFKVTWDESFIQQQNKSEKIAIQVFLKEVKLMTLTIFTTTGRIQCQGKYYYSWGTAEFPLLLDIVNRISNNPELITDKNSYSDMFDVSFLTCGPTFPQDRTNKENKENTEKQETDLTEVVTSPPDISKPQNITKDLNITRQTLGTRTEKNEESADDSAKLFISPLRLNTLTTLRETVSNLESNFVDFSSKSENSLNECFNKIAQLNILQDKVVQLENTYKARLQSYDEKVFLFSQEQDSLREQLKNVLHSNKKLQEQKNNLTSKYSQLQTDFDEMKLKNTELNSEVDSIKSLVTDLLNNNEIRHSHSMKLPSSSTKTATSSPTNPPLTKEARGPDKATCAETHHDSREKPPDDNFEHARITQTNRFSVLEKVVEDEEIPQIIQPTVDQKLNRKKQLKTLDKIVFLCDSNGKFIDSNQLSNKETEVLKCPTLQVAKDLIENSNEHPQVLIIHCGTNDLEHLTPDQVEEESVNVINLATKKHLKSKIIFSTLLNRKDSFNYYIPRINQNIQKRCSHLPNVHFVTHDIDEDQFFYDYKHLNHRGFKVFINRIKGAVYGTTPRRKSVNKVGIVVSQKHPSVHKTSSTNIIEPQLIKPSQTSVISTAAVFEKPTRSIQVPTSPTTASYAEITKKDCTPKVNTSTTIDRESIQTMIRLLSSWLPT